VRIDNGVVSGRAAASEPWRVCIRDTAGEPLGAGMVLGEGIVLTCAHVVMAATDGESGPDTEVLVNFVGLPGSPLSHAFVTPDGWAPPHEDNSADIALLRLEAGAPEVPGARLHRLPGPRRPDGQRRTVHTFGFPSLHVHGVWAFATLAGRSGPGDEWIQIDSQLPGQRVRRGFSGSGVIDDFTGAVVGMVVTEFTDEAERLAWMIPVDTIVRYVTRVEKWVGPDLDPLPPPGVVVVVGGPIANGLDPLLGAITLTVDTAGQTADEVHRRIEDRISTKINSDPPDSGRAPVTVALAGIDESSQPEALLHNVAKRLLDAGTEVEFQFSGEGSPGLDIVRRWQRDEINSRIKKLAARVEKVDAVEAESRQRAETIARTVVPIPEVPWRAVRLQVQFGALTSAGEDKDPARVRRALASMERKAERALRALKDIDAKLDSIRSKHDELKGLLRAYNAKAKDHGLVEDEQLSALYRPAARAITAAPCSLPDTEPLVEAYVRAVRRRIAGETGDLG
jgi:hypothetical protein